jgi:hypothetical protein
VNKNRFSRKNLIQRLAADSSFGVVSLSQFLIHLCAYIAAFIKLIIIEAGGYYDTGVIAFIGITIGSMPLFAIAMWLIKDGANISKRYRLWVYCVHLTTLLWSLFVIKISYFI